MSKLCVYHASCFDGFAAAWVVRHYEPDVELYGAKYSDMVLPDVDGKDVIFVDFCYSADAMRQLAANGARSLLVLDHHATAQRILEHWPTTTLMGWERMLHDQNVNGCWAAAVFDMNRSGAGIAWDFFNEGAERPILISYIEDRDLWRFNLEFSRQVSAGLATYPFDFNAWSDLIRGGYFAMKELSRMGEVLERKQKQDLASLLPITKRTMRIGGYDVPVANLPITLCSDAGNEMCVGFPFAATYFDSPTGRNFSLRSNEDGLDVARIAELYGGGGHKHAAGFQRPRGWEGDDMVVSIGPNVLGVPSPHPWPSKS